MGHIRVEQAMLPGVWVGCLWETKEDHSSFPPRLQAFLKTCAGATTCPGSPSWAAVAVPLPPTYKDDPPTPAGVLEGLRRRYDMTRVPLLGSSSGAFAAALAASGVCLHGASLRGAQLFEELGIANRWGADGADSGGGAVPAWGLTERGAAVSGARHCKQVGADGGDSGDREWTGGVAGGKGCLWGTVSLSHTNFKFIMAGPLD